MRRDLSDIGQLFLKKIIFIHDFILTKSTDSIHTESSIAQSENILLKYKRRKSAATETPVEVVCFLNETQVNGPHFIADMQFTIKVNQTFVSGIFFVNRVM